MKHLMTHKFIFGLLIAGVLALGVQGIADALTFGTSRSGDLVTVSPNQTFTIRFSVNLTSPVAVNPRTARGNTTDIEYASGARTRPGDPATITGSFSVTVDAGYTAGDTHYYTVTTTDDTVARTDGNGTVTRTTNTRNWLTESEAYDYNDESISITSTPTLMKGSTAVSGAAALVERHEESDRRLSSSITLTGSHDTAGAFDIVITDDTADADFPADTPPDPRASITFTVFVVDRDPAAAVEQWGFTGLTSAVENYKIGGDDFTDDAITTASTTEFNRVEYSVIEGSGRLYVQRGTNRKTSAARTISTSAAAEVRLDMGGTTNKVRASISGAAPVTATFIFGHPEIEIISGNNQEGAFGGRLDDPLVVRVTDGKGRAISGLAADFDTTATEAMFIPVPGTTVYINTDGTLVEAVAANTNTQVATATRPAPDDDIVVQTDSRGDAQTYFQLGTTSTETRQTVTVTAGGSSLVVPSEFSFTAGASTRRPTLAIFSGNNQRTDENGDTEDPLIVVVRQDGNLIPNQIVTFRTVKGTLIGSVQSDGTTPDTSPAKRVYDSTDGNGRAEVVYYQDPDSGSDTVTATISGANYEREVTFGINGGSSTVRTPPSQQPPPQQSPDFDALPDELVEDDGDNQSGEPGETLSDPFVVQLLDTEGDPVDDIEVTFTVLSGGGSLSESTDTTDSSGRAETTLTLGPSSGTNTVRASVDFSGVSSVTFTATAEEPAPVANQLRIEGGNNQTGELNRVLSEDLTVQLLDADGDGIQSITIDFEVIEGDGVISRRSNGRTDEEGYASARFSPRSTGNIEVEASVRGIGTISPVTFRISGGEPPDAIVKISGDNQSGRPGARLANPLVVEVIDENDDPVSGVTVNFAVTAGGGSVSPASATTNNSGRAQTRLTLGDAPGDNTVTARVSGLTAVTFTAKSGMVVLVGASQRAPMYWISRTEGQLYRLIDADIEALAPNLTGVKGIAIDTANNTLYLAVQTGPNRGEIRSASLAGRNIRTLKTLTAVPMGIAVDSAGGVAYWTNSRGRIQSIATSGSTKLTNVVQNLSSPGPIVISNGHLYWGETGGSIRRIDLTATRQTVQNVATGLGEPLSLSIAKNKLYWVERSAGGTGSLNRSNLDGSNAQTLKTFASGVPTSIAVDGSDNKIYWTKGTGKIQRSNLAGRFVKDIATGVTSPTGIVLNVAASDTVVRQPTQPTQPSQPTTYSQYDVNQDGAVNNADTKLVSRVITGAATNARADVDGSGTVDVTDLILVIANLDDDVAAPTLDVDVKSLDVDFDRVQEQVEALLASGDRSIAAQRALLYLQHLLASARPDETVLLTNYPNPFNPETWIPYHLAESTDVRVNIYDSQGVLVRALTLGHQSAGYYTSRSRAAYWDGRNAFGERVASGIYFYQLQTDEMSPLRKMVILK